MFKIIIVVLTISLVVAPVHSESKRESLQVFIVEEYKQDHDFINIEYYKYNLKTKKKERIFGNTLKSIGLPCMSTDGKYLLYNYETNGINFIKIIDAESQKQVVDRSIPFKVYDKNITSNYVAMSGTTSRWADSMEIYLYDIKTNEIECITNNDVRDYNPVILQDNKAMIFLQESKDLTKTYLKKLVFGSDKVETLHVFEGTAYKLFQWLNDGKLLMTKRDNEGTPFLWDLEAKATIEFELDRISSIMISPDGKKMLYLRISEIGPYYDLYISDIDGSNLEKVGVDKDRNILFAQWIIN